MASAQLLSSLLHTPVAADNGLILPFHSCQPQSLRRVPFSETCLMLVLSGEKQLHLSNTTAFGAGKMLLIPAGSEVTFTNQPAPNGYLAWVIALPASTLPELGQGPVDRDIQHFAADDLLLTLLRQWLELDDTFRHSTGILERRRTEMIQRLLDLGYIATLRAGLLNQWSNRLQQLLASDLSHDWQLAEVCQRLAVSESTLRRKLDDEHTSFRDLLSELRLGQGLNLLQASNHSIQQIADACGYRSASRFSERFRERFGVAPSELRAQRGQQHLTVSGVNPAVSGGSR